MVLYAVAWHMAQQNDPGQINLDISVFPAAR